MQIKFRVPNFDENGKKVSDTVYLIQFVHSSSRNSFTVCVDGKITNQKVNYFNRFDIKKNVYLMAISDYVHERYHMNTVRETSFVTKEKLGMVYRKDIIKEIERNIICCETEQSKQELLKYNLFTSNNIIDYEKISINRTI
jgi:hypothetical protein